MDAHARNALIGLLLLALFGALMFWLASWVSNRSMLSTSDEEDEQPPAEVASLAHTTGDTPGDGDGDGDAGFQPGSSQDQLR